MADIDVAEEEILSHHSELNIDAATYMKGLNGSLAPEEAGDRDFAGAQTPLYAGLSMRGANHLHL